jgi:hypothetical protein
MFSILGIGMLSIVLFYFIKTDLPKDYPIYLSVGSISLLAIILGLIYRYIHCDVKLLINSHVQIIFMGLDIVQAVSFGLLFLLGTIVSSFFWQHIIIPLIGFSLIIFWVRQCLRFVVFDFSARNVYGLTEDSKIDFENLQIVSVDYKMIQVKILDSGKTIVLNRVTFSSSRWTKIINIFNQSTS